MAEPNDDPPAPEAEGSTSPPNGSQEKTAQAQDDGSNGELVASSTPKKSIFTRRNAQSDATSWWFASTAIPLVAAALGPLANVLSIAALVTSWRLDLVNDKGHLVSQLIGTPISDPRLIYWLNVASLILGFVGNFFLLMNFTNRIRYIISLPMTIILWYIATGILIAITVTMDRHYAPDRPQQTYSQGFWYAVIAAVLYLLCSMMLMVNMLGYFLGKYPDTFDLTNSQRQLILQTMFFFAWLALGAEFFSAIETNTGLDNWAYVDGLYFSIVTLLTVGFGDLYPTSDVGRGIVFPFSVIGIILLGLVITSTHGFVKEIGSQKVIQTHLEKNRIRTLESSVSTPLEMKQKLRHHFHIHHAHHRELERQGENHEHLGAHPEISAPMHPTPIRHVQVEAPDEKATGGASVVPPSASAHVKDSARRRVNKARHLISMAVGRGPTNTVLLLKEEKDRFEAMRDIQSSTAAFKRYSALTFSTLAFLVLWCIGAIVFWQCEKDVQGLSYFQALYFGYVCLLTIGYGDLAPKSNPGRCFFVVWSVIAVPTMTILISDLGDTAIASFKRLSNTVADFYLLPQKGAWRNWLNRHPLILRFVKWLVQRKRMKDGMGVGPNAEDSLADENGPRDNARGSDADDGENDVRLRRPTTIEELALLAEEDERKAPTREELARDLAKSIRRVAGDLKTDPDKSYHYEEWKYFVRLIRFTGKKRNRTRHKLDPRGGDRDDPSEPDEQEDEGLIEWDWIGSNSPMMSGVSEVEFVLDRLCESLARYMKTGQEMETIEE